MNELQQFVRRLEQEVLSRAARRQGYVLGPDFANALEAALEDVVPQDESYPRMLYRGPGEQSIACSTVEETQLLSTGWTLVPPPSYQPKWYCEKPGTKSDLRRVELRSLADEQAFRNAVDSDLWIGDDQGMFGGRGVPLEQIIAEAKERLKNVIDASSLAELTGPQEEEAVAPPGRAGGNGVS